ncbi:unnamed protein product [Kuraishia capsulata CBS 1993]|uniref:Uncharacterized protein n=1 Tax=Kuraishia capsulata CBS 1993 TaxID=1382522 RepID=W6MKE9_9ASCO|nr:uncharacterized protein KUCA_T00002445001 [Kuraishia capsulata CBS 1993]CDK26473.1 unnamed protein product [Kuraishia capsulata CBS 1993]
MTQEETFNPNNPAEFAQALKQLNEAEVAATKLEKLLDSLEGRMDEILKEAESVSGEPAEGENSENK